MEVKLNSNETNTRELTDAELDVVAGGSRLDTPRGNGRLYGRSDSTNNLVQGLPGRSDSTNNLFQPGGSD